MKNVSLHINFDLESVYPVSYSSLCLSRLMLKSGILCMPIHLDMDFLQLLTNIINLRSFPPQEALVCSRNSSPCRLGSGDRRSSQGIVCITPYISQWVLGNLLVFLLLLGCSDISGVFLHPEQHYRKVGCTGTLL